jgi:hypothetical protein
MKPPPFFLRSDQHYWLLQKDDILHLTKTKWHQKLRITVMLSFLVDGRTLTHLLVWKERIFWKRKTKIYWGRRGTVETEEYMGDWLREEWDRRPPSLLKKRGILLLDAFKHHLTENIEAVTSNPNTEPQTTPRGMNLTSSLCVSLQTKGQVPHLYVECLLSGTCSLTQSGSISWPLATLFWKWLKTVWNDI